MVTRVDYNGYYQLEDEDGQPHSPDNDTPAFGTDDGIFCWYDHGTFHRGLDLPAVVVTGGRQEWWVRGWRYRKPENGPAVIWNDPPGDPLNPQRDPEYWVWNLQTDDQGVALGEPPEWYFPPEQDFLDSLTPEDLGEIKASPTPTPTTTVTATPDATPEPSVPSAT